MSIQVTTSLLLVSLFTGWKKCNGQLTVDILKFEDTYQNMDTPSVLASYSFPSGFSNPLDWFTEPYANIPSRGAGYVGLLYHPVPHNACAPILEHKQRDCASVCNASLPSSGSLKSSSLEDMLQLNLSKNLSKIALVNYYHTCTLKKLENLQLAGFDGMITFGGETDSQNVNNRVYDNTAKSYVDVVSHEYPVVVVSKAFAQTLLANATQKCSSLMDCQMWQPVILVRVKGDSTRQGWIQIAIGIALVVLVVGLPLITCVMVCLCCILCCSSCSCKDCWCFTCRDGCRDCCTRCRERCSKSGVYEVHELQNRVLGSDLAMTGEDNVAALSRLSTRQSSRREEHLRERANSLHNFRRNENESNAAHSVQFRRTYETSMFKEREFTGKDKQSCKSCTICLCEFEVGEKVRVLPCDDCHIFHLGCIKQWLETNSVCPVCRTFISAPNH